MNTFMKTALMIAMMASFQIGCGDDADDTDKDTGKDSEKSSDVEDAGDMDSDTGEMESDTGNNVTGEALTADADGNIETNDLGISGTWYTYDDNADGGTSTITGSVSDNGGYCAVGEGAEVIDSSDYGVDWGAGIGFNLCLDADDNANTIGTCATDLSSLVGFSLVVTGALPATELRVTFAEAGRNESTYIKATTLDTAVSYLFADATVGYASDPTANPIVVEDINALQFQVSTKIGATAPFDYCIEDVTPLTAK